MRRATPTCDRGGADIIVRQAALPVVLPISDQIQARQPVLLGWFPSGLDEKKHSMCCIYDILRNSRNGHLILENLCRGTDGISAQ